MRARKLKEMGLDDVILAEASMLVYSCRRSGPAQVHVDGMKQMLRVGQNVPFLGSFFRIYYPEIDKYVIFSLFANG
jgi:hypothetical protein